MSSIRVSIELAASPAEVWADISDVASHVEWMEDAVAIHFTTEERSGVGVAFDCDTKVGPLRLTDHMEITEWVTERTMGVRHVGLVTGSGRFTLEPVGDGHTEFVWDETLTFPWWMGGPIGGVVGGWILTRVWRRNLRALAGRFDPDA